MSGGATQQGLRKALGAIKDSTKVGFAKVNSEFKDLDVAVVKATNHVEFPPKEKHVRAIFAATSAARPRADVLYCINALARRLSTTHNWTVALKSLIVIHRTLREGDPTFREVLINYSHTRGHILNLSHFRDNSSPNAWDYSAWVRTYALFLEERLECFRILKYDVESESSLRAKELDTSDILEQLPALQQLMYRLMGCQPEGAALSNYVIQYALGLVLKESVNIYHAIHDGTIKLVDKFSEMQRHDGVKALEIYKRAGQQNERLFDFYEICKSMEFARSLKLPLLEQPPQSFLSTMEEHVKDARSKSSAENDDVVTNKVRVIPTLEYKKTVEPEEAPSAVQTLPKDTIHSVSSNDHVDLLGLGESNPDPSALEESNALALAIVSSGPTSNGSLTHNAKGGLDMANEATGWELALVTNPSSNESALSESKLAGGLDKLALDSLYEDAARRSYSIPPGSYHMGPNPFESVQMIQTGQHDPFFASNKVAPSPNVQMAALVQQQAMMMQQQMMGVQPLNLYGQTYVMPYPYNTGFLPQGQPQNNPFGNPGLM